MKVIYKGQVKLVQSFYEKVLSFSTRQSLHYLTMQIRTWETQYLIWTGCHVFFNHLLHEPLQPKRKDKMATIIFKRHAWLLHLYRYINPCLASFNISDGPSANVVYSCSELLCNISNLHKLPNAKLIPGRVTHDMPNHWSTGVSVYFSCRVMTKLALNQ